MATKMAQVLLCSISCVLAMATLVFLRLVCCCITVGMHSGDCNRGPFLFPPFSCWPMRLVLE